MQALPIAPGVRAPRLYLVGLGTVSILLRKQEPGELLLHGGVGSGTVGLTVVSSHHRQHTKPPAPQYGGLRTGPIASCTVMGHVSESSSKARTSFFSFLIAAPIPSTRSGLSREPASALRAAPAPEPAPRNKALGSCHSPSEKGTGLRVLEQFSQSPTVRMRQTSTHSHGPTQPCSPSAGAWGVCPPTPTISLLTLHPCRPVPHRERDVMPTLAFLIVVAFSKKM